MISVFSTLRASIFLWAQNFWYLVAIVMVLGVPNSLLLTFAHSLPKHADSEVIPTLKILSSLASILFVAASAAAILGLLKAQTAENKIWYAIGNSIRAYTRALFQLKVLIGLIAFFKIVQIAIFGFLFIFLFVIIFHHFVHAGMVVASIVPLIAPLFLLLFLKYALADPLVVAEQFKPLDALTRSWKMAKSHFVYFLGCYVFLGGSLWLITWLLGKLNDGLTGIYFLIQMIDFLLGCTWTVMSWCMYLRINAADQPSDEPVPMV